MMSFSTNLINRFRENSLLYFFKRDGFETVQLDGDSHILVMLFNNIDKMIEKINAKKKARKIKFLPRSQKIHKLFFSL